MKALTPTTTENKILGWLLKDALDFAKVRGHHPKKGFLALKVGITEQPTPELRLLFSHRDNVCSDPWEHLTGHDKILCNKHKTHFFESIRTIVGFVENKSQVNLTQFLLTINPTADGFDNSTITILVQSDQDPAFLIRKINSVHDLKGVIEELSSP